MLIAIVKFYFPDTCSQHPFSKDVSPFLIPHHLTAASSGPRVTRGVLSFTPHDAFGTVVDILLDRQSGSVALLKEQNPLTPLPMSGSSSIFNISSSPPTTD